MSEFNNYSTINARVTANLITMKSKANRIWPVSKIKSKTEVRKQVRKEYLVVFCLPYEGWFIIDEETAKASN